MKLYDPDHWNREQDPYGLGQSLGKLKRDTDEMLGQQGIQQNPSGIPSGPPLHIPAPVLILAMAALSLAVGIHSTSPEEIQAADEKRKAEAQAQEARREAEEKARFAIVYAQAQADLKAAREKAAAEQAANQAQRQSQAVVPPGNLGTGAGPDVPADVYR